jgi:hypothetical protein
LKLETVDPNLQTGILTVPQRKLFKTHSAPFGPKPSKQRERLTALHNQSWQTKPVPCETGLQQLRRLSALSLTPKPLPWSRREDLSTAPAKVPAAR